MKIQFVKRTKSFFISFPDLINYSFFKYAFTKNSISAFLVQKEY